MKLIQLLFILQLSSLCSGKSDTFIRFQTADPYVHHLGAKCMWTLRIPGNNSGEVVPLPQGFIDTLAARICRDLNCGTVHTVKKTTAPPNGSCFQGCLFHDLRLRNCTKTADSACSVATKVVCGHQSLRLAGHGDRCAGRVEVWKDGKWGTVCDDRWDLREGDVVCEQLRCGKALRVTGQDGLFAAGRGPVHLDELNCTGNEENLWACGGVQEESDCGHKEDAGVVCSGQCPSNIWSVSIKHLVSVHQTSGQCPSNIWSVSIKHLLFSACLAGSVAFPAETTAAVTLQETTALMTTSSPAEGPSPELLTIMVLSLALIVLFILNIVLCCLYRQRDGWLLTCATCVHIIESVHSVFLSQVASRILWTQISSVDSASVDSDYEQYDPSNQPSVGLSTFRNSQRYRTDLNAAVEPSALSRLAEEGESLQEGAAGLQYSRVSKISEDSFETSSTSSGECYQNVNPSSDPEHPGRSSFALLPDVSYISSSRIFG
uniref:SRCR domain-containing protein n=1 Tax=Fundulus heteroclitus TaxID=8078 RepID=A0A3Q2P221_FUNHE